MHDGRGGRRSDTTIGARSAAPELARKTRSSGGGPRARHVGRRLRRRRRAARLRARAPRRPLRAGARRDRSVAAARSAPRARRRASPTRASCRPSAAARLLQRRRPASRSRPAASASPSRAPPAGSLDRRRSMSIFVPGVAFSRDGHRLGFGRGYYDRALAAAPRALRIGLCHEFQLVDHWPPRIGDEPVDLVLTPRRARRDARPPART